MAIFVSAVSDLDVGGIDHAGAPKHIVIYAPRPECAEYRPGSTWRVSSGCIFRFAANGKFEVRDRRGRRLWETKTAELGARKLVLQPDGNLVIYGAGIDKALWASGTEGNPGAHLAFREDGTIVIYGTDRSKLWSSVGANRVAKLSAAHVPDMDAEASDLQEPAH